MGEDKKNGRTDPYLSALISKEAKLVRANSNGPMAAVTLANFSTMIFKAKELFSGLTDAATPASGIKTKCMGRERTCGRTVESMRENIGTISEKATVGSNGRRAKSTKEAGRLGSRMASAK